MKDIQRDGHLARRLREMEHQWKRVGFARAAGYTILVLIAVLCGASALDYMFALSILQRRLLALACHSTILSFAWAFWLRPYFLPLSPEQIAWLVEKAVPDFDEKLISAVEFTDEKNANISIELMGQVLEEAEVDLSRINPFATFPLKAKHVVLPATMTVIFLIALSVPSLKLARLVKRVTVPSSRDATVGRFELTVLKPVSGARPEGDDIHFTVRCSDQTIRNVEIYLHGHRIRRYVMDYDQKDGLFRHTLQQASQSVDFWVRSGKTRSRTYSITIMKRPTINSFIISYAFPDYTDLPSSVSTTTSGDLRGYPGTIATLSIKASVPLVEMTMNWDGNSKSIPLDLTGTEGNIQVHIEKDCTYSLDLRDSNNMGSLKELTYSVTAVADKRPSVTLDQPSSDLYMESGDTLTLAWAATDDFGIENQELRCSVNGVPKTMVLDPDIDRYDWKLSSFGLHQGDEVEYFIRAYDALSQHAETQHRKLWLARGTLLRKSGQFSSTANALHSQLYTLTNRIDMIRLAQERVRKGESRRSGRDAYDLVHNITMLSQHRDRLDTSLSSAELKTHDLIQYGFFPRSKICSDLMLRYFKHSRQFVSRDLLKPRRDEALVDIIQMLELTTEMAGALLAKAHDQTPYIETCQTLETITALDQSQDGSANRSVSRLARRAARIAASTDSILAVAFSQGDEKNNMGLHGRYYAGTNQYIQGALQLSLPPKHERSDRTINFANEAAFGVGESPFAASWSGLIRTQVAGNHTFFLSSSGASRLYINSRLIVNNDGDHAVRERQGHANLKPGLHTIHVFFANNKQAPSLALSWQEPTKVRALLPQSVLLTNHKEGLQTRLLALKSELGASANDFRQLDSLASQIRKRLKSTQQGLQRVARDLRLYADNADWDQIATIASDLKKASSPANALTGLPSPEEERKRRDLLVAAEALAEIAKQQDTDGLEQVARIIAQLEHHHELQQIQEQVRTAFRETEDTLMTIVAKIEEGRPLDGEDADDLLTLAENIQILRDTPVDGKNLRDSPPTRTTDSHLNRAAADLKRAANAIHAKEPDAAVKSATAARNNLLEARSTIERATALTETKSALATKKLKTFHEKDSEKVDNLTGDILDAYNAVRHLKPRNRSGVREAQRQLDKLSNKLDRLARGLEIDARKEIEAQTGDIEKAREQLAAAAALDYANDELVRAANDTLESALKKRVDPDLSGRKRRKAMARLEEEFREDITSARKDLFRANNQVLETQQLLTRLESADRHELSATERDTLDKELRIFTDSVLAPELTDTLDMLEGMRASRDEVTILANDSQYMEHHGNVNRARQMADTAAEVENSLIKTLAGEDQRAFWDKTDELLADAATQTEQLLSNVRELHAGPTDDATQEETKDSFEALARDAATLNDTLAQVDAARSFFGNTDENITDRFSAKIAPLVDQAIHSVAQKQNPNAHLDKTIDNLKRIADTLEEYQDDVEDQWGTHAVTGYQELPPPPAPVNIDVLSDKMDAVRASLAAAQGASGKAKEIRSELQTHDLNAEKLMDSIPNASLDDNQRRTVRRARDRAGSVPPGQMANDMNALARMAGIDPSLKTRMESSAKQMHADAAKDREATVFEREAANKAAEVAKVAGEMQNMLSKIDSPIADAAAETLADIHDNALIGEFEAAQRNLQALKSDFDAIARPEHADSGRQKDVPANPSQTRRNPATSEPGDREKQPVGNRMLEMLKSAPVLKSAASEKVPWHARRALVAASLSELRRRRDDNTADKPIEPHVSALANPVKRGDFDAARDLSRTAAAEAFAKAAAIDHQIGSDVPYLAEFADTSQVPSPEQKRLATEAAEEHKAIADKAAALGDALDDLLRARQNLDDAASDYARAFELPEELDLTALPPQQKKTIEALISGIDELDPLQKADRLGRIANAIKLSHPDDSKFLREAAATIQQDKHIQAAKARLNKSRENAAHMADELAKDLANRETVAAKQGSKAAEKLRDALRAVQHIPLDEDDPLFAPMEDIARAIDKMKPIPLDAPLPLNEEAFDAAAIAKALNNQEALRKALQADYEGAAASMRKQAEALPLQSHKELANSSARRFTEAAQARIEDLPQALADAINKTHPIGKQLSAIGAAELKRAEDAATAQEFVRASEHLRNAILSAPDNVKPILQAFETQIEKADEQHRATLDHLPDQAQEALEQVHKLAASANPVAAVELAKAEKAIENRDYETAAEQLAAASLAMEHGWQKAMVVADSMDRLDNHLYGDMNDAARAALDELKKEVDEIREAAKRQDYADAAALAKKKGETEAAKLLANAAVAQESALPTPVKDAIKELQNAIPRANIEHREMMNRAISAARRGDFNAAEKLALEATGHHREEADIAIALEKAEEYRLNDIKPLEDALQDAHRNKFGHGANDAAQSSHGEDAVSALEDAEAHFQAAMNHALRDAYDTDNAAAANSLKAAAQQVQANNLDRAMQLAAQAGKPGKDAHKALTKVKKAAKRAIDAVEESLDAARKGNAAATLAQELMGNSTGAFDQQAESQKKRQLIETQSAKTLGNIATALAGGRLADAAKGLEKVIDNDKQLRDLLLDTGNMEERLQQRDGLAEQIATAQQSLSQGAAAAEQAAADNPKSTTQLKAAATFARAGNLQSAMAQARAAGKDGQPALKHFEEADQARKAARTAALKSVDSANASARDASAASTQASQRKASIASAQTQAKQGNAAQAARTARKASRGAYEALRAARAFSQANRDTSLAALQPTLAEPVPPKPVPQRLAGHVADAVFALATAERDLDRGKTLSRTTDNLEQAADSLGNASKSVAQFALGQMVAGLPTPDTDGEKPMEDRPQNSDRPSGGGGSGNTDDQKPADVPDDTGADLGDSWSGVDASLTSEDKKRRKMQYNDYYRSASMRYLEKIAKKDEAEYDSED